MLYIANILSLNTFLLIFILGFNMLSEFLMSRHIYLTSLNLRVNFGFCKFSLPHFLHLQSGKSNLNC